MSRVKVPKVVRDVARNRLQPNVLTAGVHSIISVGPDPRMVSSGLATARQGL